MAINTAFWNRIANKYANQPVSDQAAYERKLKMTQEFLKPEMKVLEIGCGTGTTALIHAPFVTHVTATDFSERMIEIAKDKASKQGAKNVTFLCEPLEQMTAHKEDYDVIMAHSLLHLLENPDEVTQGIYNKLKPGGYFVSSTACINDMLWFFRYVAPIGYHLRIIPYVNCFDRNTLASFITRAGFDIKVNWQPNAKSALFIIAQKPAL